MKVIVLLSTFNGELYLRDQLDSLINQTLKPYKIFIRDDGSSDNTLEILNEYKSKYNFIDYYQGKNLKPAKSFFELIENAEEADYYALCDQDDVWFEDKIETAVELLEKEDKSLPLLYAGRFILTDKDLNPLDSNVSKLYGYTDFPHSLLYHTAPGCTFVFNKMARKQIVRYDIDKEYCVIHDAIIHKVIAMLGKMILDTKPHMYYRQHGNNEIGLTTNKIKIVADKIKFFFAGRLKNYRSSTAKSLLNVYGEDLNKDKKTILEAVANYQNDKKCKNNLLTMNCFKTYSINDFIIKLLVLFKYL